MDCKVILEVLLSSLSISQFLGYNHSVTVRRTLIVREELQCAIFFLKFGVIVRESTSICYMGCYAGTKPVH
jgi:hypothetical protein